MPEGQAVETPEKRKLLGFYIAAFALLGLVIAGVFLYEPLKLRYAIYRVEENDYRKGWADQWLMHCVDSAWRGNRRAVKVVLDHHDVVAVDPVTNDAVVSPSAPVAIKPATVAYLVGRGQPDLLMNALSERTDGEVLEVLVTFHECMAGVGYPPGRARPDLVKRGLEKCLPALDSQDARLARSALEFLTCRFAKELAEAVKGTERGLALLAKLTPIAREYFQKGKKGPLPEKVWAPFVMEAKERGNLIDAVITRSRGAADDFLDAARYKKGMVWGFRARPVLHGQPGKGPEGWRAQVHEYRGYVKLGEKTIPVRFFQKRIMVPGHPAFEYGKATIILRETAQK